MKRFLTRLSALSIPFVVYLLLVLVIDPFIFFPQNTIIKNTIKKNISEKIEPHMFRLIAFDRNPQRNIVLGDSRSNTLLDKHPISGYANLSYGGGSIQEIIETFWSIAKNNQLDTVLIGLNFNLYNKYNSRFWVTETLQRKNNFFTYAFNRYTFHSLFLILKRLLTGIETAIDKPEMSKEEFWKYQIEQAAGKFYEQYKYPENYCADLKDISVYCRKKNIKLIFWIPPTYIEFQNRVKDFKLQNDQDRFKSDIRSLGEVYDFDHPSDLTNNKENFSDPMHFTEENSIILQKEIRYNKPNFSIYSKTNTVPITK